MGNIPNPFNIGYDRASGAVDRRQIFNASYVYALALYLHSGNTLQRTVLGGWSVSDITVFESGTLLFILDSGSDTLGLGGGTENRPNLVS